MKKSLFFENAKLLGEELVNLGHTKVKEFGGIIDWPYKVTK